MDLHTHRHSSVSQWDLLLYHPKHISPEELVQKRQRSRHRVTGYVTMFLLNKLWQAWSNSEKIFAGYEKGYTKQRLVVNKHFAAIKTQLLQLTKNEKEQCFRVYERRSHNWQITWEKKKKKDFLTKHGTHYFYQFLTYQISLSLEF